MAIGEVDDMLREGESLFQTYKKVAENKEFSAHSLHMAYFRHSGAEAIRRHRSSLLTEGQETALVGLILAFDFCGHCSPPAPLFVKLQASSSRFNSHNPGHTQFLQRYEKTLAKRRKETLKEVRVRSQFISETKRWSDKVRVFHKNKYFPPHAIFNADVGFESQGSIHLIRG